MEVIWSLVFNLWWESSSEILNQRDQLKYIIEHKTTGVTLPSWDIAKTK
jgi:hypothetical protein